MKCLLAGPFYYINFLVGLDMPTQADTRALYMYTCYIYICMCIWYMSLGLLGGPTKLVNGYDLLTCFPSFAQAIIMLIWYLICVYMYVHVYAIHPSYFLRIEFVCFQLYMQLYICSFSVYMYIYIYIRIEFVYIHECALCMSPQKLAIMSRHVLSEPFSSVWTLC